MMKIAICLFNYFPFGGLQRDFLRIARECVARGHEVDVYTMRWDGEREPSLNIHIIPAKGLTNHGRAKSFARQMKALLAEKAFDIVVGFNKMPHLDLYYAADVCYQTRIKDKRGLLYRCMPRYHAWLNLEQSVFSPESRTGILLLSELQRSAYAGSYGTQLDRFHLLPPGICRDRLAPEDADQIRQNLRAALGLSEQEHMLLMVGSGYQTKGLDRAITGLAHLPDELREKTHLYVLGKGNAAPYTKMAKQLGVARQVNILGARDDVPDYLLAADLLLHPSYHENTGTAILEALAAGLPVLTTDVCGYAHYVTEAEAGVVLSSPFIQQKWDVALQEVLSSAKLRGWGKNGFRFAKQADIYNMPQHATDIIENWAQQSDIASRR